MKAGHSAADWGIVGSVKLLQRVQSPFVWARAAPPAASASQYATSDCKPLLFGFSCKWRHIHVRTFNPFNSVLVVVGKCCSWEEGKAGEEEAHREDHWSTDRG